MKTRFFNNAYPKLEEDAEKSVLKIKDIQNKLCKIGGLSLAKTTTVTDKPSKSVAKLSKNNNLSSLIKLRTIGSPVRKSTLKMKTVN